MRTLLITPRRGRDCRGPDLRRHLLHVDADEGLAGLAGGFRNFVLAKVGCGSLLFPRPPEQPNDTFGLNVCFVHEVLQSHLHAIKSGAAPIDYEISSWQGLESWFLGHIELQKKFAMKRGCPFGTIGNEVREDDELIRQDLSLIFEVMKSKLTAFFIREKARARLSTDAKEDQLADYCVAAVQGAMLMGKNPEKQRSRRSEHPGDACPFTAILRGFKIRRRRAT